MLMFLGSSLIIFGMLGLMYSSSYHSLNYFMNENPYHELHFDIICERSNPTSTSADVSKDVYCRPMTSNSLTPTDLLFQSTKTSVSNQHDVMTLLSSLFLHGAPLIDLSDYVMLSDLLNDYFGEERVDRMMNSAILRERFGNLILTRKKEFRFAPRNCFTEKFVTYLHELSPMIKVITPIFRFG